MNIYNIEYQQALNETLRGNIEHQHAYLEKENMDVKEGSWHQNNIEEHYPEKKNEDSVYKDRSQNQRL